jgi:hypothetical protein
VVALSWFEYAPNRELIGKPGALFCALVFNGLPVNRGLRVLTSCGVPAPQVHEFSCHFCGSWGRVPTYRRCPYTRQRQRYRNGDQGWNRSPVAGSFSVTEKSDEDHDGDGNAEKQQNNGTHWISPLGWPAVSTAGDQMITTLSLCRPPKVPAKLAENAPIKRAMKTQRSVCAKSLRAVSAAWRALA